MVPELVGRLRAAGYQVAVQPGAGVAALLADAAYEAAGALVTEHPFDEADVVLIGVELEAWRLEVGDDLADDAEELRSAISRRLR